MIDQLSLMRDEARFERNEAKAKEQIARTKRLNLERQMRKKNSMKPKRMPRKIQPIESRLHLGDELDSQDLAVRNLKFAPERKLRMKQGLLRSKDR